ncbi:Fic family protein [Mesoterricola silvestris]|uniref:Adenosine monophosphate-protein transferase n=1 Tax=Mesoterricola silvestris TaxID=2927979 RepID=A0AA48GUJ7_9BACT|nr:Fic family protein [Mesoterricola silvestris]BDU74327.1 adenosine monophosphate-protein transferase [Mesoterricola silvestris]
MATLKSLDHLDPARFETAVILRKLASASRCLAELKGVAASIPNQGILINTLGLQEAKDSSEIENIVTTHDELFKGEDATQEAIDAATKEVLRYRQALRKGFTLVTESGLLTLNHMLSIQEVLEQNRAGFRKLPGTALKNSAGDVVYTPPQDLQEVQRLMGELERFMNGDPLFDADPLIKMSLIHHQFESIQPFYDGNGRTGRILNVLYLVKEDLLDIPVLYLSSQIVKTKAEYYRRLQAVRDEDAWEAWVFYMLDVVEKTAAQTIRTIGAIKDALQDYKHRIRAKHKFYSQDLINNLFTHPYTRIEFVERDLKVSRLTATRYLDKLAEDGFLAKQKRGRVNYYINIALTAILMGRRPEGPAE